MCVCDKNLSGITDYFIIFSYRARNVLKDCMGKKKKFLAWWYFYNEIDQQCKFLNKHLLYSYLTANSFRMICTATYFLLIKTCQLIYHCKQLTDNCT